MKHHTEIRIDRHSDGGLVVRKRAVTTEGRQRLEHEREMLRRVAGPGVVVVADANDGEDDDTGASDLVLRNGGRNVRHGLHGGPVERLRFCAELARVVSNLHAGAVAHGRLDTSHVLADPDGAPVLCGFAEAVRMDPADRSAAVEDVAALGRLIHELLGHGSSGTPIPTQRSFRHRPRQPDRLDAARNLADHAEADDPQRRPDAATLAARLEALLTDLHPSGDRGRPPDRTGASAGDDEPADDNDEAEVQLHLPAPRRRLAAAGGLVGLALVGLGVAQTVAGGEPAPASTTRPSAAIAGHQSLPEPDDPSLTTRHQPTTGPLETGPAPGGCASYDEADALVPRSPCAGAAPSPAAGVVIDGVRFLVGDPTDRVLLVDPGCEGRTVPLVIRPDGSVFGFSQLADDEPVHALSLLELPAGSTVASTGDPCPDAVGVAPDGTTHLLDLAALIAAGTPAP